MIKSSKSGYTGSDNEYDTVSHVNEINPESEIDNSINPDSSYQSNRQDAEYDDVTHDKTESIEQEDLSERANSYYKQKSNKSYSDLELDEPPEYDVVTAELEQPKTDSQGSNSEISLSQVEYDDAPYDCKFL